MPTKNAEVAKATAEQTSADLSQQWLELAMSGKDTAVDTMREFVATVEKVVPGAAMQRRVVEAWLEMAQALVHAQNDAMRGLLRSVVTVNVNVDTDVAFDPEVHVDVPTTVNVASREPKS